LNPVRFAHAVNFPWSDFLTIGNPFFAIILQ
jgi:hypothetical protein